MAFTSKFLYIYIYTAYVCYIYPIYINTYAIYGISIYGSPFHLAMAQSF